MFSKRHTGERHHSYSKRVTITILGAISDAGVTDITEHFLAYVSNVMDVLDKNNMQGYYLVMDNAPIHTPAKIRDLVESRHYKCLYLPPYSPFLNPIEEFWSKVKAGVRRNALTADDRLSERIYESVQTVTRVDCQAWIRHAVSYFPRCELGEKNL